MMPVIAENRLRNPYLHLEPEGVVLLVVTKNKIRTPFTHVWSEGGGCAGHSHPEQDQKPLAYILNKGGGHFLISYCHHLRNFPQSQTREEK
jgi:hypothetical protein